ncbi:adenine-specific DNA-methyltransferase [Vibrio crassostreae]|uniref:site-specific DNA-methyltransferase n=1 Tax=Vibrio crassostreae TaxID=246167 RepID=UPI00119A79F3|nr:site-specific DNA-methyltransferase [Vibrio crassostreae]TWD34202.1 adenine-specific DNA-methyltransferase [Vibrio crassostreae]CAH6968928.1 Modification methylase EcaI [Vibrio chagasii]CAH6997806.1 Modification methylase EcaI [Vibrio chagasii]CAH7000990.1 Modification methylase EcaI [Vibrio chagasii]
MATGVLGKEKLSEDALLAGGIKSEPWDLPDSRTQIALEYENKVSQKEILRSLNHDYLVFNENSEPKKADKIPLDSFILADNFYGLKKLTDNYTGKIKLIYLDPPYGTGMEFQSRDLEHAYRDIYGTAAWTEMIRRRLIIMRELLSQDGTIYVHIGHQMLFHLKVIMDEVFGPDNFRNLITRRKCSSKNSTRKQYPNVHDYVLFYSKSNKWLFNQPGTPAPQEWIEKEYTKVDDRGRYKLVPIHAPGTRNGETGKEWRGMMPPPGKHWQFTPSRLEEFEQNGEIHWSKNGNPRRKVYLQQGKTIPITDLWDQYRDAHHQSKMITGYPTEKNLDMLKMIVEASTNEGDIVLDPFCGSGTTVHAARDLNRHWLGIDQSFTAANATVKRMKHGLNRMGDYVTKTKTSDQHQLPLNENSSDVAVGFNLVVDKDVYEHYTDLIEEIASI